MSQEPRTENQEPELARRELAQLIDQLYPEAR